MIINTARPERTGRGSGSRVRGGSNRAHPCRARLARAKREPRDDLCRCMGPVRTDSRQQLGAGIQRPPGQLAQSKNSSSAFSVSGIDTSGNAARSQKSSNSRNLFA